MGQAGAATTGSNLATQLPVSLAEQRPRTVQHFWPLILLSRPQFDAMPPKNKGKKGKKAEDDDYW